MAEDVVAKVALELTTRQTAEKALASESEVSGLIWQMVKFRARDELRSRFVRSLNDAVDVTTIPHQPSNEQDPTGVDARRFLTALARRIEALPETDQRLIMRDVASGDEASLSGRDRVRLHRLRQTLARETLDGLEPGVKK
jgi:hypothetical protein